MEGKEESKNEAWNPTQEVMEAMSKLGLDHKDAEFKKETVIHKFEELATNKEIHEFERQKYQRLLKICVEHKFWGS